MRTSLAEENEKEIAKKYFQVYETRASVPPGSLVVGRYSVLPFYKELEEDLKINNSSLINTFRQHNWIANVKEWYEDLQHLTPKTWFDLSCLPDAGGPFVLKGQTNSKKFMWKTHMFAKNKQEAIQVYGRLLEDSLIGQQEICIRQYVPLKKLADGLNGLDVTEEYRLFVLDGKVISGGFYWSNYIEDLPEDVQKSLTWGNIPQDFLNNVLTNIGSNARFLVVDIARQQDGNWMVVELNDGQFSGLSENHPEVLYKNLQESLDITPKE